jgi:hypothetical protein
MACSGNQGAAKDRALFEDRRAELERLVSSLRACGEDYAVYAQSSPTGGCEGRSKALRSSIIRLNVESASVSRRPDGSSRIEFVTGSSGLGCRGGIVWTDGVERLPSEEYEALTDPPGAWWRMHLDVC